MDCSERDVPEDHGFVIRTVYLPISEEGRIFTNTIDRLKKLLRSI